MAPPALTSRLVEDLLAQRTGRLGPAILAHIAFNAVAVAQLHIW